MNTYADTSFLFSVYIPDLHSAAATNAMSKMEFPVFLTPLGELELLNAIHLRVHRREITRPQAKQAVATFLRDMTVGVYFLKSLPASSFQQAVRLAKKYTPILGTRSLDILHVASALDLRAKTFFTFDQQQAALAEKAGLHVPHLLPSK